MLLEAAEMDVELVKRRKKRPERLTRGQLREGIDILREALSAIAALAVGPRHDCVRLVDVT